MQQHPVRLSLVPDPAASRRGVEAVRAALSKRVAIVQASAGWGKTTAVRAAIETTPHHFIEAALTPRESGGLAFMLAACLGLQESSLGTVLKDARSSGVSALVDWFIANHPDFSKPIVIDDLHLLIEDRLSLDLLAGLVKRVHHSRWVLVLRHAVSLPVATWLAYGDASLSVSEEDLRLTNEEIADVLRRDSLRDDANTIRTLAELTSGWAVAVQFGRHALERSSDLVRMSTMTKEVAFGYLTDEVCKALDAEHHAFLRQIAFFGKVGPLELEALGYSPAHRWITWLREAGLPIRDGADGIQLHDLFAEYLRRSISNEERTKIVGNNVAVFGAIGRHGDALDIARFYGTEFVAQILEMHGFSLLDKGRWESIEHAVQGLPSEAKRLPAIMGLRGALEAFHGSFDRAESLYLKALSCDVPGDLRSIISQRLSLMYFNLARKESVSSIEPALECGSDLHRCEARSIHASALAITGNISSARKEMQSALRMAEELDDDATIAKIRYRLALVHFYANDFQAAEKEALLCANLAERIGEHTTYMYAQSMLCSTGDYLHDDSARALWHAQQLAAAAARAGQRQWRATALWIQYALEVERGRRDRVETLERELDQSVVRYKNGFMFCFAAATRMTWDGRLSEALQKILVLDGAITGEQALREYHGAVALFAAFAGKDDLCKKHIDAAGRTPRGNLGEIDRRHNVKADIYIALAEIFIGRSSLAKRRIPVETTLKLPVALAAFTRSLSTIGPSVSLTLAEPALEELRAAGYEGFADMVAAVLRSRPDDVRALSLTDAEIAILRALASGASTKQLAEDTGRSVETIYSHVKSAARKLAVSGVRETIATARRLGIIE